MHYASPLIQIREQVFDIPCSRANNGNTRHCRQAATPEIPGCLYGVKDPRPDSWSCNQPWYRPWRGYPEHSGSTWTGVVGCVPRQPDGDIRHSWSPDL